MNKVIDKSFRSCRFVSTIVKHPVLTDGGGWQVREVDIEKKGSQDRSLWDAVLKAL